MKLLLVFKLMILCHFVNTKQDAALKPDPDHVAYSQRTETPSLTENENNEETITVFWIRHGESIWNVEQDKKFGWRNLRNPAYKDAELNKKGQNDAVKISNMFVFPASFTCISSPLRRAAGTLALATINAQKTVKEIFLHPTLQEFGVPIDCEYDGPFKDRDVYLNTYLNSGLTEGLAEDPQFKEHSITFETEKFKYRSQITAKQQAFMLMSQKKTHVDKLFKDFFELAKETDSENIVVGGHSLTIRKLIAPVLAEAADGPQKDAWKPFTDEKLANGSIVKFTLTKNNQEKINVGSPIYFEFADGSEKTATCGSEVWKLIKDSKQRRCCTSEHKCKFYAGDDLQESQQNESRQNEPKSNESKPKRNDQGIFGPLKGFFGF